MVKVDLEVVVVDLAMTEAEAVAVAVVDSEAAVEVRQNGKTLYYLLSKGLNL